jgi:cell division protein ZapA (FtsZ GTPase activity inhibitor)
MSTISIKVQIAGRQYPLSIQPEEETLIRATESKIAANIQAFQDKYGVQDSQDLLAMTLLQMATQAHQQAEKNTIPAQDTLTPELETLNTLVESYLK